MISVGLPGVAGGRDCLHWPDLLITFWEGAYGVRSGGPCKPVTSGEANGGETLGLGAASSGVLTAGVAGGTSVNEGHCGAYGGGIPSNSPDSMGFSVCGQRLEEAMK